MGAFQGDVLSSFAVLSMVGAEIVPLLAVIVGLLTAGLVTMFWKGLL